MKRNLLIVGAGIYGVVAYEIATDMGCFEKIGFIDDESKEAPNGIAVTGTTQDIIKLKNEYSDIVVAIGNPRVRLSLLRKMKEETHYRIISLVSPKAHVSPSAQIMDGCIIEPMAVVHACCTIHHGCIISAGAVINHASVCHDGVHVDCNATVEGYCLVPAETKVCCGEVYKHKSAEDTEDFDISKHTI